MLKDAINESFHSGYHQDKNSEEISYGSLDGTYKHTTEDRIKLGKGAKDLLDSISRTYSKSPNFNLMNLKIFYMEELEFLIIDKKYSLMFRIRN
ncbi:hypothetical protein C2G38_2151777 [Gigaspora rosea]|uniref:Uncharacterized protein n=1 Tax=Gigaspora rosea TaxID=44941 RepID=A0A397W7W3_9GLOM|nr:hypothetical protein C2G38_2151777 [Gigaspora rosea]